MKYGWAAALALLAPGCDQENAVFEQTQTDTWTQAPTDKVDVLFVIDDSHSMTEEQAAVAAGFASFTAELETNAMDFHLAAISTSFDYANSARGTFLGEPKVLTKDTPSYAALFQDRVQVGTSGQDKEKGLEAAAYALSPVMTSGVNSGFLRPEAFLLIIWVSDENDCSDEGALGALPATECYNQTELLVPVEQYVADFWNLKDDRSFVQVGAIVGPPEGDGSCPDATVGRRYLQLVEAMGGTAGNICAADYSDILGDLGLEATGVLSSFQLSDSAKPDSITVFVEPDGQEEYEVLEDPANGWTYDATTNFITFNGTSVPPRGSKVSASYTVAVGG
jgi:hypothetical protein